MTAIAALIDHGTIWIGGDCAGVNQASLSIQMRKDSKVFINGQFAIGFTSSFRMGQLLRYSFTPPAQDKKQTDEIFINTTFIDSVRLCLKDGGFATVGENGEQGGSFIVGYKNKLYNIEADFQVGVPLDSFAACGCGQDLCLGSLYSTKKLPPKKRILMALEAAARFSAGVRGPFKIISL